MLSSPASLGKSICGEGRVCVSKSYKETDNCQIPRNVTAADCSMRRDRAAARATALVSNMHDCLDRDGGR